MAYVPKLHFGIASHLPRGRSRCITEGCIFLKPFCLSLRYFVTKAPSISGRKRFHFSDGVNRLVKRAGHIFYIRAIKCKLIWYSRKLLYFICMIRAIYIGRITLLLLLCKTKTNHQKRIRRNRVFFSN